MSAKAPSFPMIAQEARRVGLTLCSFNPETDTVMLVVDRRDLHDVIRVSTEVLSPSEARRAIMGALKAL